MTSKAPSTPDQDLRALFQLTRRFRDDSAPLTERIEELMESLRDFRLAPMGDWDAESLARARHFAEEIIILYVGYFYDVRKIPVTFYKREKWVRRRLDAEFSRVFTEIARRAARAGSPELILQEPIYYLLQKAREHSFPKGPRSQGHRPHAATLKMRFHLDLARRLDPDDPRDPGSRRVLLPYEI